jgi:hypothetical protein
MQHVGHRCFIFNCQIFSDFCLKYSQKRVGIFMQRVEHRCFILNCQILWKNQLFSSCFTQTDGQTAVPVYNAQA